MPELIQKYFPTLSEAQRQQFAALDELYHDWNSKINVISRKDIDNLYEHHVLHSLAIAKAINFREGTRIMDFGCGGGFPGTCHSNTRAEKRGSRQSMLPDPGDSGIFYIDYLAVSLSQQPVCWQA